jgi:hypothetical protein
VHHPVHHPVHHLWHASLCVSLPTFTFWSFQEKLSDHCPQSELHRASALYICFLLGQHDHTKIEAVGRRQGDTVERCMYLSAY